MTDFGITTWDVLLAFVGGFIASPAFIFAAMGLCVAGAFALLICIVIGGNGRA